MRENKDLKRIKMILCIKMCNECCYLAITGYNLYDVELWREGEYIRTIASECRSDNAEKFLKDKDTCLKNMNENDADGNYEIKLKHVRPVFFGKYGRHG